MKFEIFGYKIEISKKLQGNDDLPVDLKQAIETLQKYGKRVGATEKQKAAAAKARTIRQKRTQEKIINAINLLKLEGKNLSEYQIAKTSGCSINTIKKYRDLIQKMRA